MQVSHERMMLFGLGINHQIPRFAFIALDDLCRGRVAHTLQRTSEFGTISSVMILETQIEMLASIEGAIDTRITRYRAFLNFFGTLFCHLYNLCEKQHMLRKCRYSCQRNNSSLRQVNFHRLLPR